MFAQFFGALNDNILKQVLTFAVAAGGMWAAQLGAGGQGYVALCMIIPFILLSGIAGQIADRTSKQRVTVIVKVAELGIAIVAFLAFWIGNLWLGLASMLLLGIQSAFFGPAKYGMIPEVVSDNQLGPANGLINMSTNIAAIIGAVVGGIVAGYVSPTAERQLDWAPGATLIGIAILGLIAATAIPKLRAMDSSGTLNLNPFGTYIHSIREMAKTPLLLVACSWAFFYLIGWMAMLILPDYRELLNATEQNTSILMAILGVAIGVGSVTAGLISGKGIEARLVPIGAVGMVIFFFLLGSMPLTYGVVAGLLGGAGFFAGFYIVPLQALLQHLSPDGERGRFLGTANALSFVAGSIGTGIFMVARKNGLPSNRIFLICGVLAVIAVGWMLIRLRPLFADRSLRAGGGK